MIIFIKSWCEGIIIAVILSIIIEMLMPEGNNKKYLKVVIGIYILFVIIGPILEKINNDYDLENFFVFETIETTASIDLNDNIKKIYIEGIEETIKNELNQSGYLVKSVNVKVNKQYENIEEIEIKIFKQKQNENLVQIKEIKIGENKIEEKKYEKIKNQLSENYSVPIENILIIEI